MYVLDTVSLVVFLVFLWVLFCGHSDGKRQRLPGAKSVDRGGNIRLMIILRLKFPSPNKCSSGSRQLPQYY